MGECLKKATAKPEIVGAGLDKSKERVERYIAEHRIFFWEPYPWQQKALAMLPDYNLTAPIASNKIGKSCFGANVVCSWAMGFEPWNVVDKDTPGAVFHGDAYYNGSSLGIKPPVSIIITGEDWKLHLGRVIVPELKKWAPFGWYQTKKNEQGVEYYWEWHNGSTFTLMSYTQDDDLFESFRAQGAWEDEPPPKSKHKALSRGLLLDNGKTLMTLTPLKEAWILDDIVLSGRKDIGIVDKLKITDNPDLVASDYAVLRDMGVGKEEIKVFFSLLLYDDPVKKIPVSDRGHRAELFLDKTALPERLNDVSKLKMLKFIKDIEPADVPPRVFGEFKSLIGRVLKEFDLNIHRIKPFTVPTDWPVTAMIDFHLSTPQAVSYWAVNKQEINYCVAETWKNMNADEIADDIIRKLRGMGWNIKMAYIDPLSKGDTAYMRNAMGTNLRDTYSILEERLAEHGITLCVASKDKDSGIKNIQTWLKGPNGMPTCYLFEDCERHFFEVSRWVFDDAGKPAKENDHFMENWYRYTLTGARYEDFIVNPLPLHSAHQNSNSWMAM